MPAEPSTRRHPRGLYTLFFTEMWERLGYYGMRALLVGLSSVTKLAPKRLVGQMMGLWFLATSLGNLIAGLAAGRLTSEDPAQMPQLFLVMVGSAALVGLVLLVLTKPIKKLMAGVE